MTLKDRQKCGSTAHNWSKSKSNPENGINQGFKGHKLGLGGEGRKKRKAGEERDGKKGESKK